jgi:CheY-like chemotaxis protein/CRP-like cAMP-binding protein
MKKILIIEDNRDVRENTSDMLELAGYKVAVAPNGQIGLKKVKEFEPDLILCDIMMPEKDGYQVLEAVMQHPKTAQIPFIFLTAKTEKSEVRKGMNLGADDYLTKPFEETELLEAVASRLRKHEFLHQEFSPGVAGLQEFVTSANNYLNTDYIELKYYSKQYKSGDYLFMEGAGAHHLYFVKSGLVKTYKSTEAGKELITGLNGSSQFIGQLSMLNPEGVYLDAAVTVVSSEIYAIPKTDFIHLLETNREIAQRYLEWVSENLMEVQDQLVHMAYWPVKQRVARALLKLNSSIPLVKEVAEGIQIAREDLAGMVGTATETTIRALSELKADGIIRMGKARSIIITNMIQLEELAEFGPE